MRIKLPGKTSDGSTVEVAVDLDLASVTVTAPPPPAMLVGVNAGPVGSESGGQAITNHAKLFPGMAITRVFASVGKGIPSWTGTTMSAVPAGMIPHVSFKDWDPAAILTWLDAMPADRAEVWLTYNHEPEGDLDPALFRQRWVTLADLVSKHRNRPRVRAVPILTLYWARHKGDWRTWWPGVGDAIGWDSYNEVAPDRYEDPATFLDIPISSAAEVGLPLVVPELGAVKTTGDSNGAGRAAWITAVTDRLRSAGCRQVSWWCANGTNGLSYHLDQDPAGLAAWRSVIAKH